MRREASWTEEDGIAAGKDAGEQLKKDAGPDFFDW